jgi:hypothetical protein
MRKYVWKQKAISQAVKALFLAKYVVKNQESVEQQTVNNGESLSN